MVLMYILCIRVYNIYLMLYCYAPEKKTTNCNQFAYYNVCKCVNSINI